MTRRTKEERIGRARARAKRTIVALVGASNGKLVGKLRLYKAFYKAHIEYFNATGLDLTGYPMVHMQNGPGIDNAQELIDELMEEGIILETIGTQSRPKERVYTLLSRLDVEPDGDKLAAIEAAAKWANGLDEEALKTQSHNRSWQETSPGEAQNIFLDVLSEESVEHMRKGLNNTLGVLTDLSKSL